MKTASQESFDARGYTQDNTGRGRPDQICGSDHTDTVFLGTAGSHQWVRFENTGAAESALLDLRKELNEARSVQQWNEIANAWYAAQ
jgi:hypothetical protein